MSTFDGFPAEVFEAFAVADFAGRMAAIRAAVTPRLAILGEVLAPSLSGVAGHPLYPHVAQHRRRRVNPPDETWVAWARSARGYKAFVHFEAGVSGRGVFARVALKPEARTARVMFRDRVRLTDLQAVAVREEVVWYRDGSPFDVVPVRDLDAAALAELLRRLERPQGAAAVGLEIPRSDPTVASPALVGRLQQAFEQLAPLYALAVAAPV